MMYPASTEATEALTRIARLLLLFTPLLLIPLVLPVSLLNFISSGSTLWRFSTDAVLNSPIPLDDVSVMHIPIVTNRSLPDGNPWRGASSRKRRDIISSVSGCGGSVVPALQRGSIASLRYVVRDHGGHVIDFARSDVHIVLGTGQTPDKVDDALIGVCAGELVSVRIPSLNHRRGLLVTVYVSAVAIASPSTKTGFRNSVVQSTHFNTRASLQTSQMTDDIAAAVNAIPGRRGGSCTRTCASKGLVCDEDLFPTVNNCPKLKQLFTCVSCQIAPAGAAGTDMPAWVSKSAPAGHARGACLVAPHSIKSTCNARYKHTRRLCPCIEASNLKKWKRIRIG